MKQPHYVRCLALEQLCNSLCGPRTKMFGDPWASLFSSTAPYPLFCVKEITRYFPLYLR